MTNPTQHEVTQLLAEWSSGDESALAELLPLVEKELHRLAQHYISRERAGHALQTTALSTRHISASPTKNRLTSRTARTSSPSPPT